MQMPWIIHPPLLEYAAPVWSPSLTHLNDSIESVQRAVTRRVPGQRSYNKILQNCCFYNFLALEN